MRNFFAFYEKFKEWSYLTYKIADTKFEEQFSFHIKELTFGKFLEYLYRPKDSSSLAITRILFGLAMLFDIPDERGGAMMEKRWGDPLVCHFPLIPFIRAVPMPYMAIVYAALWIGALGIALGYKYRLSSGLFTICYWYLFLIEKSFWNNHSYLFGLIALLLAFTQANSYWSIDTYLDPSLRKDTVPYWNYFILKYQFFILYFMAGMKKGTAEWLTGYSVQNLSEHWVFNPFKLFLTVAQTDWLVVHWFVFVFDLTVALWMMLARTRHLAMFFCALFHLMNSRLFRIGMFPWVCLAAMPLFYPFDWPKIVIRYAENYVIRVKGGICKYMNTIKTNNETIQSNSTKPVLDQEPNMLPDVNETIESTEVDKVIENDEIKFTGDAENDKELYSSHDDKNTERFEFERKKIVTFVLIIFHVLSQAFLPYSHFITKGYNNWTKGLYGYSWDMMVHTWDIDSVVIKVIDNTRKEEFYIDPYIYTPNDRWTRHGDMIHQYAKCLKENLIQQTRENNWDDGKIVLSENVSIYFDVWCSMNGRFTQRMFDPKVDVLAVPWSPFQSVSFLMPLLDEALDWRTTLHDIKSEVHSWNNYSDVLFVADFPGYDQEKYVPPELTNITLTVLDGTVAFEPEISQILKGQSYLLTKGNPVDLLPETFHRVINIGESPAFYMYTFANSSEIGSEVIIPSVKPKLPIGEELLRRFKNMLRFSNIVVSNLFKLFFQMKPCI